jgi:hypothetical protein
LVSRYAPISENDTYISQGGVQYDWNSWRTLAPLILGTAGLVVFIIWEKFGAAEPLIRLHIFYNRTSAITYTGTFIHGMVLWCMLYYMPLYYEAVKGFSPILSGVALFPQTFTVAPSAVVVGITITLTGKYRWAIWVGWFLTTLGMGLLYILDVNTPTAHWILLALLPGLGCGILFPSMSFAIQAAANSTDLAFAVAMFSFFRAFGQSVGVAIGGTIFQNSMRSNLASYPQLASKASELAKDATALVQIIKSMPHDDPSRADMMQAYADSLRIVWIAMCAFAAVAGLLSIGTKSLSLNRGLDTEHGFTGHLDGEGEIDIEKAVVEKGKGYIVREGSVRSEQSMTSNMAEMERIRKVGKF